MLWVRLIPLLLAALLACETVAQGRSPSPQSRLVRTVRVEAREPQRTLRFTSVTRAIERASLSFTVSGRLVERLGDLGSRVAKGSILARLDVAPLENAVVEADAALSRGNVEWRRVRRQRERVERLYEVGGSSRREREDARAAEEAARVAVLAAAARVEEAERRLDEASLRAPFSGTISEVLLEPGEYAHSGVPVIVVSGDTGLEVVFEVPEAIVDQLRPGGPVTVRFPMSRADEIEARIQSVGRVARASGSLFPIVVRLAPHAGTLVGMSAEVVLTIKGRRSLLVPIDAVIDPTGGRAVVLRIRGGRAEQVEVAVLELFGEQVVVAGELEVDDEVVVSGHGSLLDGDPVDVAEPALPASAGP